MTNITQQTTGSKLVQLISMVCLYIALTTALCLLYSSSLQFDTDFDTVSEVYYYLKAKFTKLLAWFIWICISVFFGKYAFYILMQHKHALAVA